MLVVRKVAKSNRDSTFQMCLDTLSKFSILPLCNVNQSNMSITLPNGSVFLFYGCDDSEKLKSIAGITDIVCEECTELSWDDVTQLNIRLRAHSNNLQMFFMFNPVSKANWVYKHWFADGVVLDENTMIIKTTYKDNKFLPESYIQTLESLRASNPTRYRVYTLGEFTSLDKLVFNNYRVEEFDYKQIQGTLLIGCDFGFVNDPTTIIASILDETNKRIFVFDEHYKIGLVNNEIANVIISKGYSKSIIIADSAEQKSIEEIRRLGITRIKASVKGADSVLHGIQRLQQYQIIVHPNCQNLIVEFDNYSWKKDKQSNEYINKPIDEFNHCIDALRYSMQCVKDNRMKVLPKYSL
ncbi:MAG: PBSX family phage terminase large subunit [Angelakisella sp.]|nr:PBSX family phage terminase large subunit [Angelakisella sp.]